MTSGSGVHGSRHVRDGFGTAESHAGASVTNQQKHSISRKLYDSSDGSASYLRRRIFATTRFTDSERELMKLAKKSRLTVRELSTCLGRSIDAEVASLCLGKHIVLD